MNKLELGVQATAVVADAAVVNPGQSANKALVSNGTNWLAQLLVNANVDAAAAIAYAKLNLAGSIVNNDIAVGAAIAQSKLANGPGFEIGYSQITAPVNVVSTTEATGTTIVAPGAITFDGAAVICEFWCPGIKMDNAAAGDQMVISLFEGATQIGRFCTAITPAITAQMFFPNVGGKLRFTPTAAAHTYTVTAKVTSTTGTPQVLAGVGSTADYFAAFVRFTKV